MYYSRYMQYTDVLFQVYTVHRCTILGIYSTQMLYPMFTQYTDVLSPVFKVHSCSILGIRSAQMYYPMYTQCTDLQSKVNAVHSCILPSTPGIHENLDVSSKIKTYFNHHSSLNPTFSSVRVHHCTIHRKLS